MFVREAAAKLLVSEIEVRAAIVVAGYAETELGDRVKTFFTEHWRPDIHDSRDAWVAERAIRAILADS